MSSTTDRLYFKFVRDIDQENHVWRIMLDGKFVYFLTNENNIPMAPKKHHELKIYRGLSDSECMVLRFVGSKEIHDKLAKDSLTLSEVSTTFDMDDGPKFKWQDRGISAEIWKHSELRWSSEPDPAAEGRESSDS